MSQGSFDLPDGPAFNANRLKLARQRRGLTKKALAERLGMSTRILLEYETEGSQHVPPATTVERIARVLAFPVEYFMGPDLEVPAPDGVSFRALSNLSARLRDQAFASAAFALALAGWIADRFKLPEPDVPEIGDLGTEAAAEAVRHHWGLGERPIRNMVHLLEAHGVRVYSLSEECAEVDAFSFWHDAVPFVFLNTWKSAERSRMDAAHELGHLVLHRGQVVRYSREAEQEARVFASAFLMPASSIVSAGLPRHPQLHDLVRAKQRWNVAVSALAYRMHKLGLLSDWEHRMLYIQMGEAGYRRSEPDSGPREKSQVLDKVFKLSRARGQSRADIARELVIPLNEMNKVIFGLVLAPVGGDALGRLDIGL